jgi:hypothetical protein
MSRSSGLINLNLLICLQFPRSNPYTPRFVMITDIGDAPEASYGFVLETRLWYRYGNLPQPLSIQHLPGPIKRTINPGISSNLIEFDQRRRTQVVGFNSVLREYPFQIAPI